MMMARHGTQPPPKFADSSSVVSGTTAYFDEASPDAQVRQLQEIKALLQHQFLTAHGERENRPY